jgi:hypothetical protein
MPNIRTYTSPVESISNPETAARASADAGRSVGRSYSEAASFKAAGANAIAGIGSNLNQDIQFAGDVVTDFMAQKETAAGAKTYADMLFGLNQSLNKTMRENPDDPTVAARFREQAEGIYEKFRGGFTTDKGQKWAESRVEAMRSHFDTKILADEATRAGVAIKNNIDKFGNTMSGALYTNPEDLKFALSSVDDFIKQQKSTMPNLDANTAARLDLEGQKIKEGHVKTAIMSRAMKNPAATIEYIQSGDFQKEFGQYIDKSTAIQVVKSAEEILRRETAQRRADQAEARRVANEKASAEAGRIVTSVIDPDTGQIRMPRNYMNLINDWQARNGVHADQGTASALVNFGIARAGEPTLFTDPKVQEEIMVGLSLPPSDPRATTLDKLLVWNTNKLLSDDGFKQYVKIVENKTKDPQRMELHGRMMKVVEQYKSTITKSNPLAGIIKPEQDQQYGDYLTRIEGMFNEAWQRGGYAEASKLVDPTNPQGIRALLGDYAIDTKQGTKYMQQRLQNGEFLTPVVQPRKVKTETITKPGAKPNDNLTGPDKTITGVSVEPLPPIPQRNPGESTEDYLRRRNGGK